MPAEKMNHKPRDSHVEAPQPDYEGGKVPPKVITASRSKDGVAYVAGRGPADARVMFVVPAVEEDEATSVAESKYGRTITQPPEYLKGQHGAVLRDIALSAGLDLDKCYYTAWCKWLLPRNIRSKPTVKHLDWGRAALTEEIGRVRPDIIVCMGKVVFDQLCAHKLDKRDAAGGWFDHSGSKARLYLMENPRLPTIKPEYIEKFRVDFREVAKMRDQLGGATITTVETDYRTLSAPGELAAWVREMEDQKVDRQAVDCEWHGVTHLTGQLRSFQLGWAPGRAVYVRFMDERMNVVLPYETAGEILRPYLNRPDVKYYGHHWPADAPWMHKWLGLDWYQKCVFDTEFALQTADEYSELGLERIGMRFTDLGRYDVDLTLWKKANPDKAKGGYGLIPDEIIIPYACLRRGSLVQLGDGSWERIEKLVKDKYTGEVVALHEGRRVLRRVTNWHRRDVNQKDWYRLRTPSARSGRWGLMGPVFTPDHEICTQYGKVRVDKLEPNFHRVVTDEHQFSETQMSVVLGSLLGDGGIARSNDAKAGLLISQRPPRIPYADWKVKVLESALKFDSSKPGMYRSVYCRKLTWLMGEHPRQPGWVNRDRKLVVTRGLLDKLGPLGLAVWYQDDGVFTRDKSCRIICTKLTEPEREVVTRWFSRFGDVYYNEGQGCLMFSRGASKEFLEHISPYMHPSCAYKADVSVGSALAGLCLKPGSLFEEDILEVVSAPPKKNYGDGVRYCLSVEEAETFSTEVGFVSNCKDVDVVVRAVPQIRADLERQELWEYYDSLFRPFTSDVFTNFVLEGLPVDVAMLDEMRNLYSFARDTIQDRLRTVVLRKEADALFAKKLASFMGAPAEFAEVYAEIQTMLAAGECDGAWNLVKRVVGAKGVAKIRPAFDHLVHAPEFNLRSHPDMRRWLYDVKGYEPVKSTSNKDKGLPSIPWEKVLALPPEAQKQYNPAVDIQTLEILADTHSDPVINELLKLNAVGNICKGFLKEGSVDKDGELVKENGLHFWVCPDDRIHGQFSATETGRPRAWNPNLLNIPKYMNDRISEGIQAEFKLLEAEGRLPEEFRRYMGEAVPSLRSVFKAPPGWVMVESDYQTAEIRALGYISGDKNLIRILNDPDPCFVKCMSEDGIPFTVRVSLDLRTPWDESKFDKSKLLFTGPGGRPVKGSEILLGPDGKPLSPKADLHWSLAEMVRKVPRELLDKEIDRNGIGKPGNFSTAYGASGNSLERKIEQDTGIKPAPGTGDAILEALKQRQPVAVAFLEQMERVPEEKGQYRAASGRIRHCPMSGVGGRDARNYMAALGREMRNFPCQESVGATALRACVWMLDHCIRNGMQARPMVCLYDSVVTLCPAVEAGEVARLHQRYMTDENTWVYHGVTMDYPIDTDFNIRWSTQGNTDEERVFAESVEVYAKAS